MSDEEWARHWTERSSFRVALDPAMSEGAKLFAPSAERNTAPLLEVLRRTLPERGRVLEVASGTGQHALAFAGAFPDLDWTPSDPEPAARASIEVYRAAAGLENLGAPLDLDVTAPAWWSAIAPPLAAIVAINLVHISPWQTSLGLLDGARALLAADGVVVLYGCFSRSRRHLSPSNEVFDRSLKHRNPEWGVRDVGDVERAGRELGLAVSEIAEMPANNLALVLRRAG